MRISEPIVKSGFFWIPSYPAAKLPGVLSIADGGEIELEILGNFDPPSEKSLVHDVHPVDRVVGEIEKYGLVTLDGCHYRTKSFGVFGGVSKSTLSASRLVIGCAFEKDEPLNFNSFRFAVDGLEEWIRINAIQVNYHSATSGATIKFDLPKDIDICRASKYDMFVALSFGGALPGTEIHKASDRLDAYVQLTSENLQPIENFVEVAYRIVGSSPIGHESRSEFQRHIRRTSRHSARI